MNLHRTLTSILTILMLVTAPLAALAGNGRNTQPQNANIYDNSGRYQGKIQSNGQGQTKSYDKSGRYQGKAVRQGKSIKLYDKSGRYQGRVTVR